MVIPVTVRHDLEREGTKICKYILIQYHVFGYKYMYIQSLIFCYYGLILYNVFPFQSFAFKDVVILVVFKLFRNHELLCKVLRKNDLLLLLVMKLVKKQKNLTVLKFRLLHILEN